ncbi:MAG: DUF1176 domain-containing protein [Brevundimonas sp.]|nr:DUF1176 domain-containing protein [Brevundimonas sp.]
MRLTIAAALLLTACSAETSGAAAPETSGPAPQRASAPSAMPSERRAFRDWIAICDNGNACFAFAAADNHSGWVRVAMEPGPEARPEVAAGYWPSEDGATDAFALTVDGTAFPLTLTDSGGTAGSVAADRALAAVRAMADGRSGDIGPDGALSLSGAAAALLWIDERQGRVGTVTALRRPGSKPASSVPPAPPLPEVRPAPAVSQAGFGESDQTLPQTLEDLPTVMDCRAETSHSEWVQKEVMSARLGADTELWGVPCIMGAYNIGHEWFITGPGGRDPRPARLTSTSGEPESLTINGGYAATARTLVAFAKGRGVGDCGTASTWTWTGREFVLSHELEMTECWGVPVDFWPTTWRTR